MKCEICNEREASVQINQSINGVESEQYLCPQCAAAHQSHYSVGDFNQFFTNPAFGKSWLGDLLGNAGMLSHTMPQTTVNSAAARCPKCNWSFEDINKTGLLGCPHCYEHFESSLKGLFQRIQRGSQHVGRKPGRRGSEHDNVVVTGSVSDNNAKYTDINADQDQTTQNERETKELSPLEQKIKSLKEQQDEAVAREDYLAAARLRDEIKELREGKEEDQ